MRCSATSRPTRESNARTSALNKRLMVEWFGQDSWRATPKLTVEMGLRFSWASALKFPNGDAAAFVFDRYDPARAPLLVRPALNPQGQRVGRNPVTGEFVPAVMIGSFVPGTGDPFNGTVTPATPGYEDGFSSIGRRPIRAQARRRLRPHRQREDGDPGELRRSRRTCNRTTASGPGPPTRTRRTRSPLRFSTAI